MGDQDYCPDDNSLFGIRQDLKGFSQEFARTFVETYGKGPYLRRTVPPNQVVLLDPTTKQPVYKNSSGSITIHRDFIEPWNSDRVGLVSCGPEKRQQFAQNFAL